MAIETTIQREINGEWVRIKIEASLVWNDRQQVTFDVIEAHGQKSGEAVIVKADDISLTPNEDDEIFSDIIHEEEMAA